MARLFIILLMTSDTCSKLYTA